MNYFVYFIVNFLAGFITGLLISILFIVVLLFFRRVVEKNLTVIEKKITNTGPLPKGNIYIPEDDSTEAREKIIEENRKKGLPTKFGDLQ